MPDAQGGCLCGQVRYRVSGALRPVFACHCRQCRKTSGNFVAATAAPRGTVDIEGEVTWYASSPEARRGFCGTCGSNLFWDGPEDALAIFMGSFDGDPGVRLAGHIFCAHKGAWYEIEDGLPQAAETDPSWTRPTR